MTKRNAVTSHVERTDFGTLITLHFCRGNGDEGSPFQIAQPIVWGPENPERTDFQEPAISLRVESAQRLMDELWLAGLRPALGQQSEGVTAAQARHLEDMRTIAFAKLEVAKP